MLTAYQILFVTAQDYLCSCLYLRASVQPPPWFGCQNVRRTIQTSGEMSLIEENRVYLALQYHGMWIGDGIDFLADSRFGDCSV